MAKTEQIWNSLQDEEYRREFAEDEATGLAFQVKALREKAGWTQEELASRIGKRQETISLWENPNYGNYTLKTLKSLARAFDLVPVFRLGAFSEMVEWNANLTPSRIAPPGFEEECRAQKRGWTTSFWVGGTEPSNVPFAADVSVTAHLTTQTTYMPPAPPTDTPVTSSRPTKKEPTLAFAA